MHLKKSEKMEKMGVELWGRHRERQILYREKGLEPDEKQAEEGKGRVTVHHRQ